MSKKIAREKIPFSISNAVLAFALDLAGVPAGKHPCVNRYTKEMLFALGGGIRDGDTVTRPSKYAGPIEEAALAAVADEKPGAVTYRFELTQELNDLAQAFTKQEAIVAVGNTVNTTELVMEVIEKLQAGSITDQEAIVRLTCIILKTYITYKQQWKGIPPSVTIRNSGRSTERKLPNGEKIVSVPGAKVYRVDISKKNREKLYGH